MDGGHIIHGTMFDLTRRALRSIPVLLAGAALYATTAGMAAQARPPAGFNLGWVQIPGGTFEMGCVPGDDDCGEEELPRHLVTISRPFELMAREVTVGQFRAFAEATGYEPAPPPRFAQTDNDPVVNVSWDDAAAFCEWAGGRLPTEADWEHAARGGDNRRIYPWGNEPSHDAANYGTDDCCGGLAAGADRWENTAPGGAFAPNGYGLFDMGGNVWEWVADWFEPYGPEPVTDPGGPSGGELHTARGGSWLNVPAALRASGRLPFSGQISNVGFRCARALPGLRAAVRP